MVVYRIFQLKLQTAGRPDRGIAEDE